MTTWQQGSLMSTVAMLFKCNMVAVGQHRCWLMICPQSFDTFSVRGSFWLLLTVLEDARFHTCFTRLQQLYVHVLRLVLPHRTLLDQGITESTAELSYTHVSVNLWRAWRSAWQCKSLLCVKASLCKSLLCVKIHPLCNFWVRASLQKFLCVKPLLCAVEKFVCVKVSLCKSFSVWKPALCKSFSV